MAINSNKGAKLREIFGCGNCVPTPVDCDGKIFVFMMNNVNAQPDDNFSITLNDNFIGNIDLSQDGIQNGALIIASNNTSLYLDPSSYNYALYYYDNDEWIPNGLFASPPTDLTVFYINPNIINYNGSNNLVITDIQNNDNGNFGTMQSAMMNVVGNSLVTSSCGMILEDIYGEGLVFPESQSYAIDTSMCCSGIMSAKVHTNSNIKRVVVDNQRKNRK